MTRCIGACAVSVVLVLSGGLCRGGAAETRGAPAEGGNEDLFARSLRPIEASIKAWDFAGAAQALAKLHFESPDLAERLATRRAEVALLAKLKGKMIAAVNDAKPRLRKGTLLIPGLNGDLVSADEQGIVAELPGKGAEKHTWAGLPPRSLRRLLQRCVDTSDVDDLVGSALVALVHGDVAAAEADFAAASALGAKVGRHLGPLADAALDKALACLEQRRFDEAVPALAALEGKYAGTPWLAAHKEAVAAALRRARGGASEAQAEKLYGQAARMFRDRELLECKPLVEKLKADFADTKAVRDAERKPTVAEMAAAVAKLGKTLTVSQKGKADFTSIQAAIDAAPPHSTLLITDGETYAEKLLIPKEKPGLTLKGKKGLWPTLTTEQSDRRSFSVPLLVEASPFDLDGLIITHWKEVTSSDYTAFKAEKQYVRARSCFFHSAGHFFHLAFTNYGGLSEFDTCLFATSGELTGSVHATNCVWVRTDTSTHGYYRTDLSRNPVLIRLDDGTEIKAEDGTALTNCALRCYMTNRTSTIRFCTIIHSIVLTAGPHTITDSIVGSIESKHSGTTIERCNVFRTPGYVDFARAGPGCMAKDPLFQNPGAFDFRLRATSPCRKQASDGGDLGVRYTPQMLELVKKALELRQRGVFRFSDTFGP